MKQQRFGCLSRGTAVLCLCVVPYIGTARAAVAGGPVAVIELVTRASAGLSEEVAVLPASEHVFAPGSTFVVEVWAQTADAAGLSSVSLDLTYAPIVSVTSVVHSTVFSELQSGLVDNAAGFVNDLSGSHLGPCGDQVGVAPQWALLATLQMSADVEGETAMSASSADSLVFGTAICGVGDADPQTVAFGAATIIVSSSGIPAVSEWGVIVLTTLLMVVATIIFGVRTHRGGMRRQINS